MLNESIVICGYGSVSPLGVGVAELVDGLRAGRSGVCAVGASWNGEVDGTYSRLAAPVPESIDVGVIPRKLRRSMGRDSVFAQLAVQEALAAAGLEPELLRSGRVGVAIGSTITSPGSLTDFFDAYLVQRSVRQVPANGFFRVMGHSSAANVANCLGITGRVQSTAAACASGLVGIGVGCELVAAGIQDVMICGGVEELHPATTAIFDSVGASSTGYNDHPERAPAPFDRDRDGTVCGEGAGIVVVEREAHARARRAPIFARVAGFASTTDGHNMAQPGVESMAACMRQALRSAGLEAADIDYVSAHGTGTQAGDRAEAEAIATVFGGDVPVSSLKGYLGHTLGASGAIEAVACIEMMRGSYLLPTGKLSALDPECASINHLFRLQETRVDRVMKCSFGFGGTNAALVLERT